MVPCELQPRSFLVRLTCQAPDEDPLYELGWKMLSAKMRSQLNMSPNFRPWTSDPGHRLVGVPPSLRMRDCIDIAWAAGPQSFPFHVDISQCVSRKKWSVEGQCLTTQSLVYDFEHDQVWSPTCLLALQGLPVGDLKLDTLSSVELKDLAGEGMFVPCLAMIITGVFLNVHAPWWETQ